MRRFRAGRGADAAPLRYSLAQLLFWEGRVDEMRQLSQGGWESSPDRAGDLHDLWRIDHAPPMFEKIQAAVTAAGQLRRTTTASGGPREPRDARGPARRGRAMARRLPGAPPDDPVVWRARLRWARAADRVAEAQALPAAPARRPLHRARGALPPRVVRRPPGPARRRAGRARAADRTGPRRHGGPGAPGRAGRRVRPAARAAELRRLKARGRQGDGARIIAPSKDQIRSPTPPSWLRLAESLGRGSRRAAGGPWRRGPGPMTRPPPRPSPGSARHGRNVCARRTTAVRPWPNGSRAARQAPPPSRSVAERRALGPQARPCAVIPR